MSKHFKVLFFSIFLYIVGYLIGERAPIQVMSHFTKIIFALIAVRVLLQYDMGFMRLPMLSILSFFVGWLVGGVSKADFMTEVQFVFFLMGAAPFFVISALLINELREYWNYSINIRAGMSAIVGYGFVALFQLFTHLHVPDLTLVQFLVCLVLGFLISYGTFYLYRWEAEKLDGNLALSFFIGVPVMRAIRAQKNHKLRVAAFSLFEAIYVPLLAAIVLLAKFLQSKCLVILDIGWNGKPTEEASAQCALGLDHLDHGEYLVIWFVLSVIVFCSFLVLNSRSKTSWAAKYGRTSILILLSLVSVLIMRDNLNFTLAVALWPLSALLIRKEFSR